MAFCSFLTVFYELFLKHTFPYTTPILDLVLQYQNETCLRRTSVLGKLCHAAELPHISSNSIHICSRLYDLQMMCTVCALYPDHAI